MRKALRQTTPFEEIGAREIKQNRARYDALKEKTEAGPAFRECGKQTLQSFLPLLFSC
jgi:hypothetical protein